MSYNKNKGIKPFIFYEKHLLSIIKFCKYFLKSSFILKNKIFFAGQLNFIFFLDISNLAFYYLDQDNS